ncbi:hypothetical protein EDB92DRAFT_1817292 [Lactarius akahatsu]|uniref:Uncharacterized protein n=1 Tax=Lactarius akahatsu TaxID=416441 RepID=A0AAD4LEB6_9AGAM|nr:hypothetical protein EDB92DRAFT_1817292 [Lactarius akahatsu]
MKRLGRTDGRKEAGVMATVLAFLAYSVATKSCKRDGAFPILASSKADQLPVDDQGPPFFDPRDARAIRYLVRLVRATQTQATIGRHYSSQAGYSCSGQYIFILATSIALSGIRIVQKGHWCRPRSDLLNRICRDARQKGNGDGAVIMLAAHMLSTSTLDVSVHASVPLSWCYIRETAVTRVHSWRASQT